MADGPLKIRLGHSLGRRDNAALGTRERIRQVLAIAAGEEQLLPRDPLDSTAVRYAETILQVPSRPVYAFVGDLHPELGPIGLIFELAWLRRAAQGLSRCDSGGLAGAKGGFACLDPEEVHGVLIALSTPQTCPAASWERAFSEEVESSYSKAVEGYVQGESPDTSTWTDARVRFIAHAEAVGEGIDRRLWTWEARISQPPLPEDLIAVALSSEAFKELTALHTKGIDLPQTVRLLFDQVTASEPARFFYRSDVRDLLAGKL